MAHNSNRLLSPKEAMACLGIGRTKFYQGVQDGLYPAPVYPLGSKRAKFVEAEILAIQKIAIDERDARLSKGLDPVPKEYTPKTLKCAPAEARRVA